MFVEDLSNLLNTGEVPNLFDAGERYTIGETMRKHAKSLGMKDPSKEELWALFVSRCIKNLHLVLCFSPVGAFVDRLRKFPSITNCTTIDWFLAWPSEGFNAVASSFLANVEGIPLHLTDKVRRQHGCFLRSGSWDRMKQGVCKEQRT